jgi:hypothetical protein
MSGVVKRLLVVLSAAVCLSVLLSAGVAQAANRAAAPGTLLWAATVPLPDGDRCIYARSALCATGDVYVAMQIEHLATGDWDVGVARFRQNGRLVWQQVYRRAATPEFLADVAVDACGNVTVCGEAELPDRTTDVLAVRWNASGSRRWAKLFAAPAGGIDTACAVVDGGSGSAYVAGTAYKGHVADTDWWLLKLSTRGLPLWTRTWTRAADSQDAALALTKAPGGGVLMAGRSIAGADVLVLERRDEADGRRPRALVGDVTVIRYQADGRRAWVSEVDIPGCDLGVEGIARRGSHIAVGGTAFIKGEPLSTAFAARLTTAGVVQWTSLCPSPAGRNVFGYPVALAADGRTVVVGSSCIPPRADERAFAWGCSTAGAGAWSFTDTDAEVVSWAGSVKIDGAGRAYVAGTRTPAGGQSDVTVMCLGPDGAVQWSARYDDEFGGSDEARSLNLARDAVYAAAVLDGRAGLLKYAR